MAHGVVEREAKLSVDMRFTVPDMRDLVKRTVRLPEQRLLATYFDTPDRRLWARKITLRHRSGEGTGLGLWTLKLPQSQSGSVLGRIELEWTGSIDVIPAGVGAILIGVVRNVQLREVATLATTRQRLILQGPDRRLLAELDDDRVTIQGGLHDGERFRQIEVELDEGDESLLAACSKRLVEAGAQPDDHGPKLAWALDGDSADRTVLVALGPESPTAEVVRFSIQTAFNRILDHDYLLRIGGHPSPEAIHQTRVAARRLRTDLKTFSSVLDPVWVGHLRGDLKWLGEALGRVRDVDVLGDDLGLGGRERMGDTEGVARLRRELRQQRRKSVRRLLDTLESDRYLLLLDKLLAATERPPFLSSDGHLGTMEAVTQGASKSLPRMVRKPWKKLQKEVRRAGSEPTDRRLHEIRIRSKQLRYAAEAASPVVGKQAKRTARAAERLQTQLGEHHDAVVAEQWLRRRARDASASLAFSAGQLANEQERRQQRARSDWASRWNTVDRRARAWLG